MGVKASSYSDRHPGGDARPTIGDGMRVRHGFKALTAAALLGTMLASGRRHDVGRRGRCGSGDESRRE